MMVSLINAFDEERNGYSVDRVIADPELNARFIRRCRSGGLTAPAVKLNLDLLNTRKRGRLGGTLRRTAFRDQDSYAFAAEMAIRSLERKHRTTLDRVLCDPELAREFDAVAAEIAPGFSSLQYRWAALRLRKTSQLKPEILGRVVPTPVVGPTPITEIDTAQLPDEQGVYVLTSHSTVLYVGEAKNLRSRLKKHLDHSDNKKLARYLWEYGADEVLIEYHVLPPQTRTDIRKALELEMIRSRNPEFNVRR